jgi:hypothetical protein
MDYIHKTRELNGKPVFSSWAGSELIKTIKDSIEYSEKYKTNVYLEFNGYTKELNSVVDLENTRLHWYEDNHNPIAEARDKKIKNILG